ncbi:MAG: hypothetical protein HOQ45_16320 [Nocardioidaceae bacterium]|nr:hypothetical protein [Nocardioidaceae bacterium]
MSPAHRARRGPGRVATACVALGVVLLVGTGLLLRPAGGPVRTAVDGPSGTHPPSGTPTASASASASAPSRDPGVGRGTTRTAEPTPISDARTPAVSSSAPLPLPSTPPTVRVDRPTLHPPTPTPVAPRPSVTSHPPTPSPSPTCRTPGASTSPGHKPPPCSRD